MAQRIAAAGNAARREDHATLAKAGEDKARVIAELRAIARSALSRRDQKNRQLWFGLSGIAIGILVSATLPGLIAREVAPAGWQWPDRMAARTLHLPMWNAGRHLLITDSPKNWNVMVDGWNIIQKNSAAIEACRKVTTKSRDTVRCTIRIGAEEKQ